MKWLLIITMIIIFLLFIPIRIKVKIHYDFMQSHGFISGYFFNIRLFLFGLKLMPNKIQFEGKKKNFVFSIIDFGGGKSFGEDYFGCLIKLLNLTHIRQLSRIGFEDNCMLSCLTCGALNAVFGSLTCVAFGDSETPFEINNFPNFLYKSALFGFSSSVDITIIKMLLALIQTFSKKIRSVENGSK